MKKLLFLILAIFNTIIYSGGGMPKLPNPENNISNIDHAFQELHKPIIKIYAKMIYATNLPSLFHKNVIGNQAKIELTDDYIKKSIKRVDPMADEVFIQSVIKKIRKLEKNQSSNNSNNNA